MPVDHRWAAVGSVVTLLSTELNALANFNRAVTAAGYDPTADRHVFADLELAVTFGSAPATDTYCEVYFLRTVDGTNYAAGSTSIHPRPALLACVFVLEAQTVQRAVVPGVTLPPAPFKVLLYNASGVAFPASGSTVKMLPYSDRGV